MNNPQSAPLSLDQLAAIVGSRHILTDPADMQPFLTDHRDLFFGAAYAVVKPGSTEQVSAVVRHCAETGTPIVPQGGNTGLVGGGVPDGSGRAVLLSLQRLDRIRNVDPAGGTLTAEAGVTLQRVQEAAAEHDRLFPLSIGSQGSCTIGGNLGTNAGGTGVLAYGNARDLMLGLEVVLADGRIWNGLRKLRKDNTGYDIRHMFIGSEGTLGIVTAAVLKLFPCPRSIETAIVGVPSPRAALSLLQRAQASAGPAITAFELMPRIGIDFLIRHAGLRDPLDEPQPWYVLIELSSPLEIGLRETLLSLLQDAMDAGEVGDAVVAASSAQRRFFWHLRDILPEMQRKEGGSIRHDVSVPVSSVPEFIERASATLETLMPGARPFAFGHLGDGNIHFNLCQPVGADKAEFLAQWDVVNTHVHALVAEFGGSISAEHGIGRLKRHLLAAVKDPVELDLMRALKRMLDPRGILNPGVLLPDQNGRQALEPDAHQIARVEANVRSGA